MEIEKQLRNQALSSHSTKNVEDSGGQEHPMKVSRISPKWDLLHCHFYRNHQVTCAVSSYTQPGICFIPLSRGHFPCNI